MILPDKVTRYLNKYSSAHWKVEPAQNKRFKNIIIIPAIAEYENLKKCLLSLSENDKKYFNNSLILIVVNCMKSSSDDIKSDNQMTLDFLRNIIEKSNDNFLSSELNIAYIDASSAGNEMPEKDGGVGLARKIGMDLSLTLFNYNIPGKNILICLDADCTVSQNYITSITEDFNKYFISAAVMNFAHEIEGEDEVTKAIICYEIFLRNYVLGLNYAGSPYAFHTIGSAMACDAESYIVNEGMNKRKAAEDFYFLEKLSKNFRIQKISDAAVYPSGRSSWRVPFGTGQRVTRFLAKEQEEYLLFDPQSFEILKKWLIIFDGDRKISPDDYLRQAGELEPELKNFLINQNFVNDMKSINSNSKSNDQLVSQKRRWFDGFKTLKLIHHLRDTSFPSINMFDALDKMFAMKGLDYAIKRNDLIPPMEIQKEYLTILRDLEKTPVAI